VALRLRVAGELIVDRLAVIRAGDAGGHSPDRQLHALERAANA
jgi:hypothetical protein